MIQDKSMLVDLTIAKWSATKFDKAVSAEVEASHNARDAGRYNKRLIDKAHLSEIDALAGRVRKYHYSRTLPWTDKGQRLLPSALFMEYRSDLVSFKAQYQAAVDTFLREYPALVNDARLRLNTMFVAEDYPQVDDLKKMFGIEIEVMPVPNADDFRVSVAKETQDEIREQITASVNARQLNAIKECWSRVREVVGRIAEQCGKESGRLHDSLMDNARDLANVLHGLNITSDAAITIAEQDIRALLVPMTQLRTSPTVRKRVADAANAILKATP